MKEGRKEGRNGNIKMKTTTTLMLIMAIIMIIIMISGGVEGKFYEAAKDFPPQQTIPLYITPGGKYYLPLDVGTPPQVSLHSSLLSLPFFPFLY